LCCARWKAVKLTELVSQSQMVRTQADSLQVESRSLSNNHPKVTPSAEALAFQATFPLPAGDLYPALQQTYFSAKWELPSQGVEYSECGTVEAKSWCPGNVGNSNMTFSTVATALSVRFAVESGLRRLELESPSGCGTIISYS